MKKNLMLVILINLVIGFNNFRISVISNIYIKRKVINIGIIIISLLIISCGQNKSSKNSFEDKIGVVNNNDNISTNEPENKYDNQSIALSNTCLYVGEPDSKTKSLLSSIGLKVKKSNNIPSDLTKYSLIIVNQEGCNPRTARFIEKYVRYGGGVLVNGAAAYYFAGNSTDLSNISEWFGARTYTNVGNSYAQIKFDNPLGSDLLAGDVVGFNKSWGGAAVANPLKDAIIISIWDYSSGNLHAFIHSYYDGRVSHINSLYNENSVKLFKALCLWTIKKNESTISSSSSDNQENPEDFSEKPKIDNSKQIHDINKLIEDLNDPYEKTRENAAQTLGDYNDNKVIDALCEVVYSDRNPEVRKAAIVSLGKLGGEKALKAVIYEIENCIYNKSCYDFYRNSYKYFDVLERFGFSSGEFLIKLLSERTGEDIHCLAAQKLGNINYINAIPYLIQELQNRRFNNYQATSALIKIGKPSIIMVGEAVQNCPTVGWGEHNPKISFINILSSIGDESSVPYLVAAMRLPNGSFDYDVLTGLSKFKTDLAARTACEFIYDKDANLNQIQCIANMGINAVPYLLTALGSENEKVRIMSSYLIIKVTGRDYGYMYNNELRFRERAISKYQEWYNLHK
jgi:HEAT repeat protein